MSAKASVASHSSIQEELETDPSSIDVRLNPTPGPSSPKQTIPFPDSPVDPMSLSKRNPFSNDASLLSTMMVKTVIPEI